MPDSMGRKRIWQVLDEVLIDMIRKTSPLVAQIPETCKFCGRKRLVRYGHYRGSKEGCTGTVAKAYLVRDDSLGKVYGVHTDVENTVSWQITKAV